MWVSYKHQHTEFTGSLSIKKKVELFYAQTLGWQLHFADLIARGGDTLEAPGGNPAYSVVAVEHSGFAVLFICLSYFELVGSMFVSGDSKKRFKAGVKHVFPRHFNVYGEAFLERLYAGARCGLYHAARASKGVGLGEPPDGTALMYIPQADQVIISPARLPVALKDHLDRLKLDLLDPTNAALRKQFQRRYDNGFD